MQLPEKQKVLQAIRDLGRRVTPADVSTKTGLPLSMATAQLNAIAAEVGGHLQVATTGDIVYGFAPGFQNAYLAKGMERILKETASFLFRAGFYLLRISFGVMLILSLLLIVMFFLILMMRGGGGRDDNRDGFHFGFFDYLILRDLFVWGTYASHPSHHDRISPRRHTQGNFLLNCFSFLFGDGNPNADIEEKKWKFIATAIRTSDGVVTSEQLAPYLGFKPTNEDGVLPALVRFDGRPEVTETGNIVYAFPSLQTSATTHNVHKLPNFLAEHLWKFSNASPDSLVPVYILAGVNFFGSWWLWLQMHHAPALFFFSPIITALVLYGTFFVALPLMRLGVLQYLNRRIESRNKQRQQFSELVGQPSESLFKKLVEAREYRIKDKQIGLDQIVYTTEKDALEQEFKVN